MANGKNSTRNRVLKYKKSPRLYESVLGLVTLEARIDVATGEPMLCFKCDPVIQRRVKDKTGILTLSCRVAEQPEFEL